MARKGKTLAQQCKFYNCEDFVHDVMLYHYACGNKKGMVEDYKELNKEARQIVVQQIFEAYYNSALQDIIMRLMFD
ncbi:hypothetical protein [Segatella sp.]|uniref:hypothetical protein n=1 Tax=Segatella sp. TaxID=2974253 RepID=UPI003AB02C90